MIATRGGCGRRRSSGWRRLGAGALAGAATAAAQPPVSWPVVLFAALPVLLWLLDGTPGPRAAFALGWAAGVGFFAAALFWIVDPFLVEPERFGWMAPFALVGMAGGLALFWAAAVRAGAGLGPPGHARILILAALWTLAEFARAHVLTGFPWALPAYAWVETPVIQTAALFGPHGLGLLTLIAGLLLGLGTWRGLAAAAVAAGRRGLGLWCLAPRRPLPVRAEPLVVRLVQPNAAQDEKWLPGKDAGVLRAPSERDPRRGRPRAGHRHLVRRRRFPSCSATSAGDASRGRRRRRRRRQADPRHSARRSGAGRPDLVQLARRARRPTDRRRRSMTSTTWCPSASTSRWPGLVRGLGLPALTTLTSGGFTRRSRAARWWRRRASRRSCR